MCSVAFLFLGSTALIIVILDVSRADEAPSCRSPDLWLRGPGRLATRFVNVPHLDTLSTLPAIDLMTANGRFLQRADKDLSLRG